MDTTKARDVVGAAARSAGRAVAGAVHRGRGAGGPVAQTLTVAAAVEQVYAACRDVDVLDRVFGAGTDDVRVSYEAPRRYRWVVAGTTVETELVVDPHGLSFRQVDDEGNAGEDARSVLTVEVHPAPQDLGSEVRLLLDLPVPDLAGGALAFTVLYRLRALLQTGEVPTLGDVPSHRRTKGADA